MGDSRFSTFAFGPYGTASAVSGAMSFGIDDTTPDVTNGVFFRTANTGATTITYFDVREPQGNTSTAHNGKVIHVLVQDNLTTFAGAGQLFLSTTGGAATSGALLSFIYFNSAWYQRGESQVSAREAVKTVTVTAANNSPNVAGAKLLLITQTGGLAIVGFSGGVVGQQLIVGKTVVSAGSSLQFTGGAQLMLAGTTAFIANDSACYQFVCDNGTRFRQLGGPAVP